MYRVKLSNWYDYTTRKHSLSKYKLEVDFMNAMTRWIEHKSIRNFLRLVPVASWREEKIIRIIQGIYFIIKDTVTGKYKHLIQDLEKDNLIYRV